MRLFSWVAAIVMIGVAVCTVAAGATELGPGGARLRGAVNAYGNFQVFYQTKQADPAMFTILAVKVYTEPSHSFLMALVDADAPAGVLSAIQAENPRAMSVSSIQENQGNMGMAAPPSSDQKVRVEYVVLVGGQVQPFTLSETTVSSISEFEFSSQPMGGGSFKHCGYCGGTFCGCIYCQGPAHTLCCPSCTLECGAIICP